MASISFVTPKTLISSSSHFFTNPSLPKPFSTPSLQLVSSLRFNSLTHLPTRPPWTHHVASTTTVRAALDGDYSSKRSSSNGTRDTIMLPGCDFNHWLIVMEFPKDPAPTREQMIDTYLDTLAQVLGSMEEAKKNMYAFSTTTYTGFQCTVSEETSEKFKGLPGVLWVLPDSYIDVRNKDYGGDKYINGEIIPCKYPTFQTKQRRKTKHEGRRYERRRDGPPAEPSSPRQETTQTESSSR